MAILISNGIILALLAAMAFSLSGIAKKELNNRGYSQLSLIWWPVATCLPLLTLYFMWNGLPSTVEWPTTLIVLTIIMPLMIATEFLWVWGITSGDYSLAVPFASFGPVFGLILGYLLFGEIPSTGAMIGVSMVIVGAYLMNVKDAIKKGHHALAPFAAILREPGPRWILINAFVFTFVGGLQKFGAKYSTPLFFSYLTLIAEFLILSLVILLRRDPILRIKRGDLWLVLANSVTWTVGFIAIYLSFSSTLMVYALGVEQSSILFAILWGFIFFKERGIAERMSAAIIMFLGVLLITIYSN